VEGEAGVAEPFGVFAHAGFLFRSVARGGRAHRRHTKWTPSQTLTLDGSFHESGLPLAKVFEAAATVRSQTFERGYQWVSERFC
jgi:hypothetical protein